MLDIMKLIVVFQKFTHPCRTVQDEKNLKYILVYYS